MRLKEDVRSLFKPEVLYGKQGEEVKIISEKGTVCIVENINGDRFPVNVSALTEDPIKEKPEAVPDTTAVKKPIINRVPVSKKAAPINQKSLFDE
ncbi:MAG: hypothetical protein IPJ81_03920 [Chitinophagaceae bacterium]|nr:hypothetical protein [Chitinophagaceae bacterium]